ncbi:MAG: hypothetical protein KAQ92_03820, partial [Candidatus Aenigmarchaeota archaeon]|nr:hypothetical protein [Candidatus Aenigmarchaeota archaeon]
NFKLFIIFFLLAFLLMLGREITKDIEDVKGDKNRKKTIATQFSVKHAGALSALTLSTSVIVSLILTDYFGRIYIITIFFADTILLYCIIRLLFHPYKYASECQRLEKIAVIIMLLGLFLSSMM